jgi:hypothetical protein
VNVKNDRNRNNNGAVLNSGFLINFKSATIKTGKKPYIKIVCKDLNKRYAELN